MQRRLFIKNIGGSMLVRAAPLALIPSESGISKNLIPKDEDNKPGGPIPKTRPVSKICLYNGKPTVFINNKAYFPMAYLSYYPEQFRYKNIYESGVRFFSLSLSLGGRFVAAYRKEKVKLDKMGIWQAPGEINFDQLDHCINEILEVAPEAFIFPRIYCDSPAWWDNAHPAEVNRTVEGLPMRQSFSSLIWRDETTAVLRCIVRHMAHSAYADRVIGLHVTVGETEESVHHDWLGAADYSLAAQQQFRQWLLHKYKNEQKIQDLFHQPWDELNIPSPKERARSGFGKFYDPNDSLLVMDYNAFKCREVVEVLESFCRSVKEESNHELLTGVFYGYNLVEWRDHLALSRLLKSPYVDFLSNTNGGGRLTRLGEQDMHFLSETDSIHKANKLFYYEADTRTCMSRWISQLRPDVDPYHEYDLPNWLGPDSIEATLQLLKAVFSRVICTGSANWWFDLWGGWYDHPRILSQFKEMQKIGSESIQSPRDSVSEVCVIVSEKSLLYFATATRTRSWIQQQMNEIGRIGAPYDIYLISDLKDVDLIRYKVIIFINALAISEEEIETIRRRCMKDNRIMMWLYAPAIFKKGISKEAVADLIGMEVDNREAYNDSPVKVSFSRTTLSYNGMKVSPFWYITGGASAIYGRTSDGDVVLAEKKSKDFTHILASLPPVPWQVIQYFAKKAQVHIYSDQGDVVYANKCYLSISASLPGKRLIRLPGRYGLRERLGERSSVLTEKRQHQIEFAAGSCKFFELC